MKIRSGFVSNSSSSSFVVAFPKRPKNEQEVMNFLFPNSLPNDIVINPYGTGVSALFAAQQVFEQLDGQHAASVKQICEEVNSGWFDGCPEYNWCQYPSINDREAYDAWWKVVNQTKYEASSKVANKFISDNKGAKFYIFGFSDEECQYQEALEHGGTFDNLPHLVISHH